MKEQDPLLQVLTSPMSDDIDQPILSDPKENKNDEEQQNISIIFGKKREMSDTYKKSLAEKAAKNPNSVEVETPEGWMTVKEAIEKGYDPKTGEFTEKKLPPLEMDQYFQHRGKEDRDKIKRKANPKGTNVNKEQMEGMGERIEEHPDFMPGNQPREEEPAPPEEGNNPLMAMLGGGVN